MVPFNLAENTFQSFTDTTICYGDSIYIDGEWKKSEGNFRTMNRDPGGNTIISNIKLSLLPLPKVNLGEDMVIKENEKILLDAYTPGAEYRWQDGSNGHQYLVTQPGTYRVTVMNQCGIKRDSINISYQNIDLTSFKGGMTISPNPFKRFISIKFYLEDPEKVMVTINSFQGGLAKTLSNSTLSAGHHELIWDGTGQNGEVLQSGIYFLNLVTKDNIIRKTIVKMK
jgi:hypothetical protein